MKKLFIITVLLASLNAFSQQTGYLGLSNETMQYDKQKHALGGIGLGFVSYIYFDTQFDDYNNRLNTEAQAYFKSAAFVLSIAVLKEANDKWLGNRAFSVDDIGATMFGHFCGATTSYLIRKRVKNRSKRKARKLKARLDRIDEIYKL